MPAPRRPAARRHAEAPGAGPLHEAPVVDLERYVPAFLSWIANKLSRGASQHYLSVFDVGIETWRCLVLLAVHEWVSAQQASRIIGMDKGTISRCFKGMLAKGLISLSLDASDGRLRVARLTPKGRRLHDQILGVALAREEALLSVLTPAERETLIRLLKRLHENLPAVEVATTAHLARHFPGPRRRKAAAAQESDDG